MTTRQQAIFIFETAVAAVHPKQLLGKYLSSDAVSIRIGSRKFQKNEIGRLVVIAVGKAAAAMAQEAEKLLGENISYGLCITKHGHSLPLNHLVIIEAGHPIPDADSVKAAMHLREMLEGADASDIFLLLLSGGASSLIADLPANCLLADIQCLNKLLINSGASIQEINTIRKHTGTLKGGKMAALAMPAQVITLAISDVPGDDVSVIASGLTVPDQTTFADAIAILKKYPLEEQVPASIRTCLQKGLLGELPENPGFGNDCFLKAQYYIVASNTLAINAAGNAAEKLGFHTAIFKSSFTGEVLSESRLLIQQFKDYRGLTPACIIIGGEPVLAVKGKGKGGRCQHFVLNAWYEMNRGGGADMRHALTLLACGTDGTDGPTDAAGAIADIQTLETANRLHLKAIEYLNNYDAYSFFEQTGGLILTGPTQTNAGDIIILLVN
jgi:glycerate 2-kinase